MPKAKEYRYNGFAQSVIKLRQIRSLGETLSLLHKNGVFHRDIKPANLLLYKNKCCLTDFGLVWSVNETNHITGANEAIGPVGIRPPEMEFNVDKLKEETDFQKVDVYLFAKTIWILLTGNRNGFRGEYRRGDKALYLDNTRLRLGQTIEPLHRMMEEATVYENKKRITIEKCLEYLEQQIAIADGSMLADVVETLRFKEIMNEAKTQIESDAVVFEKPEKIHVALSKMENIVELFVDDCGKEISLGTLVRAAVASDNIFEINLKKDFVIAGQKRKRKIFLNISKMEIKKENIVEISTDYLKGGSVSEKNVNDIASMVNFQGDTVGVDGKYIFIFRSK
jgi:serine/threonine protein kinase